MTRTCIDCGDPLPPRWPTGQCSDCEATQGYLEQPEPGELVVQYEPGLEP